jgi:hypothetical protein
MFDYPEKMSTNGGFAAVKRASGASRKHSNRFMISTVRVGFAEGQTIRVAHRPDGQAFLRITRNDGQAVVAPGLPSGAGVEQEAALLLGILFSAITPLRPSSCFDFFVVSESIPLSDCLGGKALLEASHTCKPVEPLAISRLGGYSSVGRASRSQ